MPFNRYLCVHALFVSKSLKIFFHSFSAGIPEINTGIWLWPWTELWKNREKIPQFQYELLRKGHISSEDNRKSQFQCNHQLNAMLIKLILVIYIPKFTIFLSSYRLIWIFKGVVIIFDKKKHHLVCFIT